MITVSIGLDSIQVLAQAVLHMPIPSMAQEVLDDRDKLGVEITSEAVAWIVPKNANQHDCIVLDVPWGAVRS